jgi:hypothetical protein
MKTAAIVALLALGLLPAAAAGGERPFRYRGGFVEDETLRIAVNASDDKRAIVVLSQAYGYAAILPYAEDWEFWSEDGALLRGNSGPVNLTITAYRSKEPPEALLAARKRHLETTEAGKGIRRMEIVSFKGRKVLRNEVDGGTFDPRFRGATVVHYFSARGEKGVVFLLHLSVVLDPKRREGFDDKEWLGYAALGFNAVAPP